ncbi:MAG: hypothetical protein ACRDL7_00010 [Gaiellaceae bacterium]
MGTDREGNLKEEQVKMLTSFLHITGEEKSYDPASSHFRHFRVILSNLAFYKRAERKSCLNSSAYNEKGSPICLTNDAKKVLHGMLIFSLFHCPEMAFIILACRQGAARLLLGPVSKGGMSITEEEFEAASTSDQTYVDLKKLHVKGEGFQQKEMTMFFDTIQVNVKAYQVTERNGLTVGRRKAKLEFPSVERERANSESRLDSTRPTSHNASSSVPEFDIVLSDEDMADLPLFATAQV